MADLHVHTRSGRSSTSSKLDEVCHGLKIKTCVKQKNNNKKDLMEMAQ